MEAEPTREDREPLALYVSDPFTGHAIAFSDCSKSELFIIQQTESESYDVRITRLLDCLEFRLDPLQKRAIAVQKSLGFDSFLDRGSCRQNIVQRPRSFFIAQRRIEGCGASRKHRADCFDLLQLDRSCGFCPVQLDLLPELIEIRIACVRLDKASLCQTHDVHLFMHVNRHPASAPMVRVLNHAPDRMTDPPVCVRAEGEAAFRLEPWDRCMCDSDHRLLHEVNDGNPEILVSQSDRDAETNVAIEDGFKCQFPLSWAAFVVLRKEPSLLHVVREHRISSKRIEILAQFASDISRIYLFYFYDGFTIIAMRLIGRRIIITRLWRHERPPKFGLGRMF